MGQEGKLRQPGPSHHPSQEPGSQGAPGQPQPRPGQDAGSAHVAHGQVRLWGVGDQACWGIPGAGADGPGGWHGVPGRDSQAWQCLQGAGTQAESKHPCPARPTRATRGRGHGGQAGREELRDASQHQEYGQGLRCHLGSRRLDTAVPVVHSKPSPIFLQFAPKENSNKGLFFFFKLKVICIYFGANGQPAPQALIQQHLSVTSEASAFYRATNMAALTHIR